MSCYIITSINRKCCATNRVRDGVRVYPALLEIQRKKGTYTIG